MDPVRARVCMSCQNESADIFISPAGSYIKKMEKEYFSIPGSVESDDSEAGHICESAMW